MAKDWTYAGRTGQVDNTVGQREFRAATVTS